MRRVSFGIGIRGYAVATSVIVLALPVTVYAGLRISDAQLVRETEGQLIAESVVVAEMYRQAWLAETGDSAAARVDVHPRGMLGFTPYEPTLRLGFALLPRRQQSGRRVELGDTPETRAGARISPSLANVQTYNLSGIRVLDLRGCAIATTRAGLGECFDDEPDVAAALGGRYRAIARRRVSDEPPPAYTSLSRRGTIRLFASVPVWANGRVIGVVRSSRTSLDVRSWLWMNRRGAFVAGVVCLLAAMALSFAMASRIIGPIRTIEKAANAIARGDTKARASRGDRIWAVTELRALAQSIDAMAARLRERAEYAERFAATAGHEIRNPLTAIRGAAELLRDQADRMDAAQRARFIANIHEDAERMERLLARLLELARIENSHAAADVIDVRELLLNLQARFGDRVHWTIDDDVPAIRIAPEHLDSAVTNLVENALRHGAPEVVEVRAKPSDDDSSRAEIVVTDRGPGVPDTARDRIFDPFFTTERDRGGSGLGLAIVRAIAQSRGGRVAFETSDRGTTFRLVV